MVPQFDGTGGLLLGANHPQAVGGVGGHRVGLLQQDGSWSELWKRPVPQKNMGVEGGIVEGLLLVAVLAAEQVQKAPNIGIDHSASVGPGAEQ
mgnify:CR=1 FL=1